MPGIFDRIKDTTTYSGLLSVGTSFTVTNTPAPIYQSFRSRYAINDANIPVAVVSQTSNNWMVCWCTYTALDTLRVDQIIFTSNTVTPDAAVTFSGTSDVFVASSSRAVAALREVNTFTANNTFSGNLGFGIAPATNRLTIKSTVSGLNNTHWLAQDNGDLAAIFADSADNAWLRLWDGAGTEQFRLRSGGDTFLSATGGNVGIGTTAPFKPLHVVAPGTGTTGNGLAPGIRIDNSDLTSAGTVAITLGGYDPGGTPRHAATIVAGKDGAWVTASSFPSNLQFWTRPSGIADQIERMRIDSSGNVGIGTTSISAPLHLERNQASETSLFINNTNASGYSALRFGPPDRATNLDALIYSGIAATGIRSGNRPLLFESGNGTERMRMDVNGNFGIGTGSPSSYDAKLAVFNGNIALTTTLNKLYLYYFSAANHAHISTDTGGQVTISNGTGGVNEKLRIDTLGRVGIGTTAPDGRLDTSSTTDNLVISRSTGGYAGFSRIAPAGQAVYDFYTINGVEQARITSVSSGIFAISTGSSANERLRIDGSGNVGINVPFTGSSARLAISTNGNQLGGTARSSTLTTYTGDLSTTQNSEIPLASFGFNSGNQSMLGVRAYRVSAGSDWTSTSICLGMDVDATPRAGASIWLSSNGNTGISVVNPLARLHVNSADSVNAFLSSGLTRGLRIYHGPNGSVLEGVDNTGSGSFQTLVVGGSEVSFTTSNTERMRLHASGGVSIGNSVDPGANTTAINSTLRVLRQNTTSEGGELQLCRANDNAVSWLIDVLGSAAGTDPGAMRFVDSLGFDGTGAKVRAELSSRGVLRVVNDLGPSGSADDLAVGFRGAPNNVQNGAYTFALTDAGKTVYHDEATARIWTIPANSAIPFPIGTCIIIDNTGNAGAAGTITLQITTDTLRRGDGTAGTGQRSITANRVAMVRKTKTTEWVITGTFA